MENKESDNRVPYIVHEGIMARLERIIRRLWFAIILLIVLLVGSNVAWLVYESQFETLESTKVNQEAEECRDCKFIGVDE